MQSGKMGLKPTPPNIVRQLHYGLPGMASSSTTPQESPTGDVFHVPPWPHLHQLQPICQEQQAADVARGRTTTTAMTSRPAGHNTGRCRSSRELNQTGTVCLGRP